jgi:hypothetical protein
VKVNGSTERDSPSTARYTIWTHLRCYEVITAGQSKTFEVLATLSLTGSNAESFTTKIVEDTTYVTSGTGSFVWSDGASVSSSTWSNGKRVPGLTTTTQTMSKN